MPDPTPAELAGGTSTSATTTVNFTAQAAGTILLLSIGSDDYRTTSGSGRPESTSWIYLDGQQGNLGHYAWYKVSTGSETSVQYTIGSGSNSAYTLVKLDNIAATSFLGGKNINASAVVTNLANFTTAALTPASGERWCVTALVGSTGNNTSGPYSWSGGGSFTKLSERYTTTGYRPGVTVGTVTLDGGTPVSSVVTFASATQVNQGMSIVQAWKVASGGSSVTLTPATVSLTPTAVSPAPGQVAVTLTPKTFSLTPTALSPAVQPVAVTLTPAVVALAAQPLSPALLPVQRTLTPASLTLAPVVLSSGAGSTATLTPATVSLTARALTPQGAAVLTPAAVSLTPVAVSPAAQPVNVTLTPATIVTTARPLTATPGQVSVTLTPAALTLAATSLSPSGGQTSVSLTPAVLSLTPRALTPQSSVVLTPAAITLTGAPLTPQGGQVNVTLTPATITLTTTAVTPSAGSTVTLTSASVTLAARQLSPASTATQVTLTAAVLTLTPGSLSAAPGVVGVTLTAASVILQANPLSAGGPVGPIVPRVLVAMLREDHRYGARFGADRYAGTVQDQDRYGVRLL